jgi:hypothetical protein
MPEVLGNKSATRIDNFSVGENSKRRSDFNISPYNLRQSGIITNDGKAPRFVSLLISARFI